jgi:hypothetical protein
MRQKLEPAERRRRQAEIEEKAAVLAAELRKRIVADELQKLAALAKEQMSVAAGVANGRLTPAEGRARAAEARKVLKAAELVMKLREMSELTFPKDANAA